MGGRRTLGTVSNDTRLQLRSDAVAWRVVDEEIVALDLARSVYLGVNASGAALWPALVAGATRPELEAILVGRFDITPDQAVADVGAFLDGLQEHDLIAEIA